MSEYGKLTSADKRWPLSNHPQGDNLTIEGFGAHDLHQAVLLFCALVTRGENSERNPIFYTRKMGLAINLRFLSFAPYAMEDDDQNQQLDAGQVVMNNLLEQAHHIGDAWNNKGTLKSARVRKFGDDDNFEYQKSKSAHIGRLAVATPAET